jgi:hypothetical protein
MKRFRRRLPDRGARLTEDWSLLRRLVGDHVKAEAASSRAIANVLSAVHGDPNISICTIEALTCAIRKGQLTSAQAAVHV